MAIESRSHKQTDQHRASAPSEACHANYIGGEWRRSGDAIANVNPSDVRDTIGDYAHATRDDTFDAIEAAYNARRYWADTRPLARFEALDRIGSEILVRQDELGDMLAREEGKTLREATAEANRAGLMFKFFAAEAYRSYSDGYQSLRVGVDLDVMREPLGVIAAITPWNFPLAIPAWKIAPALAFGNTVVWKPAELVPGSAWLLSEIISRAGLPEGVFNLVMGRGSVVGAALAESPKVAGVTFTGSTTIGKAVGEVVFRRNGRIQLEMGGKNALIVMDDADLDLAVNAAIEGGFYSAGQRCTASSRVIVEKTIHDVFVSRLVERTKALRIGDARAPDTQIGPVVSGEQRAIDERYLEVGRSEGAELAAGGYRPDGMEHGYYLAPAIFLNTHNHMRINSEEIFGPLIAVQTASDLDEAIAIANDAEFGLSAGIFTTSVYKQRQFKREIECGMAQINLPTAGMDFHAPFTGRKGSSFGPPEKGAYCREFFTAMKVVHSAPC